MPDVFKIRVIRTGDAHCQIFAESLAGKAESEGPLPVEDLALRSRPFHKEMSRAAGTRLAEFGDDDASQRTLTPPRHAPVRDDDAVAKTEAHRTDLKITQEVGTSIFEFLFRPDIDRLFRQSMEMSFEAGEAGEALPIRLLVEQIPQLTEVPWESLYDRKTQGFLSLSRQTPFIRAVRRDPVRLSRRRKPPLRILGMVSRPSDMVNFSLSPIDAEGEQLEMRRAIKDLEEQNKVELHWTVSGRQDDLEDAVIRPPTPWNIFHFIGHGGFDCDLGQGYLLIQEEDGTKAAVLYSETLRNILIGPNGPQLVVLNSCKGAFASSGDLFSSTASDLAVGGVPAVVAMQFVVSDKMAKAFSRKFYECITKGDSIGTAMAITRTYLKMRMFPEWVAPVLFLGGDDTPIFYD
ncbi:CHAT domain-containing protein [Bradyrhizobium neotropicale]|uniref:CHAT domain-containing protein n=1 Tax=Bradyrhizobium neotropicale TaxID=1497615 RepID=UPI001AD64EC4|nr:CHAT domain-containing protein [Bradyrhizobium neotropicale]MBO4224732.1 CHAT domain-containing protein [Bradyrhizobium neotropicale]